MLQAGLADLGTAPGACRALLDGASQDAEQDLQAGPSLPPAPLWHPWGQSWLHSKQDLLKKSWKLLCAASNQHSPTLTPPRDSPKPKLPPLPMVRQRIPKCSSGVAGSDG